MSFKDSNLAGQDLSESAVPRALLDTLAERFRAGGMCVVLLTRQGSVDYFDPASAEIFRRLALPALTGIGTKVAAEVTRAVAGMTATSGVDAWSFLPGTVAGAFPLVLKRQVQGVLVLVGKRRGMEADPGLPALCATLGLESCAVIEGALAVPGFDEESMVASARILLSMTRDQVRVQGLEQELDSLSIQLANSYEELSLIYQVSGGMKVNRTPAEFFKQACLDVSEVMGVRGMGVALCGEGSCRQDPALYGNAEIPFGQIDRLAGELMAVLRDRKSPLLINDVAADKRFGWAAEHFSQLIAVPLQRQDQVLGCLFGIDKTAGEFDSVDSKLLNSIANESAIYLENAMLFEDVRDLMMGVLHSLTSAVDAKDAYTCGHSERVALVSRRLAQEIGLPFEQAERIYMAAILHDVGKIGVPEAVLQKTGKLTNEEFDQMKRHPVIGARILQDIKQLADIIPGVLYHHERYDGKGYPHRLSGQDIPLMGRIICLADCFDAMTSNRTYRRALPLEVALIEMRRCAGTQFDPRLAEAFLRITPEEFRGLLREHQAQAKQRLDAVVPPALVRAA